MGTTHITMMGYLPAQSDYRDRAKMLRTLTTVAERGYRVTTDEEAFQTLSAEYPQEAGISPALSSHVEAYLSGKAAYFSAQACGVVGEERQGFQYGCLSLSAEDELVIVDVDDWHFTLHASAREDSRYPRWKQEVQAHYAEWLDLLRHTYAIWQPLYCYDFSGASAGLWPETSLDDARALQPQHLYEHNYFGPALAEKIGRERVLGAPAWYVRKFTDRAALVIPNDLYGDGRTNRMAEVAAALDLPYDAQALAHAMQRLRAHLPH